MKFSAIVAAALVTLASAQTTAPIISISSPLSGTVYKAGQQAIITWNSPTVQQISQIVLAQGPSTALQPLKVIATNVDANAGQYSWTIPADTPTGSDYAFEFGTSPNLAFAGPFTIQGGAAGSTNSSSSGAASSAPAASSGAASSGPASSGAASASSAPSGSASKSASASSAPTSGANSLVAGSALAMGAAVVAAAQLF
ncbi:hypothetical protein BC940DRAFT_305455 [Gongronella butleri]|nr:hypothetical protein BC940DRAFT_305455 [Gongronella butleri]